MYATDFEFEGEKLSDYGMMICNFDGSGGIETVSSGADITFNQIKPCGSYNFNIFSSVYDSAYTTVFQVCKNPCSARNHGNLFLSVTEVSSLQRWLCRKNMYGKFKIFQEGYVDLYWNAAFSAKQIELNGSVVGLELTLYTDSPFAYMDELSVEYICPAGTPFDLWDNSDEITDLNVQIRPDVQIVLMCDGNFTLQNSMDNKIMKINNCKTNENIFIDGKNQIITSSFSSHNLASDFNFFFPKIINTYNERCNTFTPNLDCKIKITYSPIRKIGI